MKTIWKYLVAPKSERSTILVPTGAKVLGAGIQGERIFAWVQQDVQVQVREPLELFFLGTGWETEVLPGEEFVDTLLDGSFVWHVFCRFPDRLPQKGKIANDRAMLLELMHGFDNQQSVCERCGHEEELKEFDMALMLREYLKENPK